MRLERWRMIKKIYAFCLVIIIIICYSCKRFSYVFILYTYTGMNGDMQESRLAKCTRIKYAELLRAGRSAHGAHDKRVKGGFAGAHICDPFSLRLRERELRRVFFNRELKQPLWLMLVCSTSCVQFVRVCTRKHNCAGRYCRRRRRRRRLCRVHCQHHHALLSN